MCTKIVKSKYLQSPMIAYAVRFKCDMTDNYAPPYFNTHIYTLKKKCVAEGESVSGDTIIAGGYFHMFLSFKDANKAKKKMHPWKMSSRSYKLRYKIVKIKIYSRQRVHFGYIPINCQNAGMETVCAKTIVHLKEVKK
jgi:hypothetical protein